MTIVHDRTIVHSTVDTPQGPFSWLRGPRGVLASGWTCDLDYLSTLARVTDPVIPGEDAQGARAVRAYYEGDLSAVATIPVDQQGGAFTQAAWVALTRVPPGHTRTYTELAADAGRPSAVRAAAMACATNRAALFVPCHRVVRADGGLGGFRYGVKVKRALLELERQVVAG